MSSTPTSRRYRSARTGSGSSTTGWNRSSTVLTVLDPERDEDVAGHPGAVASVSVAGLAGAEPGHRFVGSDAVDGQGVADRVLLRRGQGGEGRAVGEVAAKGVPGDGRPGGELAGAVVEEVAARGRGVAEPQLPRVRGRVRNP